MILMGKLTGPAEYGSDNVHRVDAQIQIESLVLRHPSVL
jgi:hypothetical protein